MVRKTREVVQAATNARVMRERIEGLTDIAGKAAVVTGGGTGIGMGIAKALAQAGASVAIADIMIDNARRTAEDINSAGGRAVAIPCDVCDRAAIAVMRDEAERQLGPVQLLFANAGATNFDRVVDIADNDVDWIIQVNLLGVINTVRAFLPGMIAAGGGHITATSSMAGLAPGSIPVHAIYSAAKMGIIGFMQNLALEVHEHGVRLTTYCPGGVASGMGERNAQYRPARFGGPRDVALAVPETSFADKTLRMYAPEDVAPIVLNAVRRDRPFVFDHAEQRPDFRETYADVVEACYDDIAAWEAEHGTPELVELN